MPLSRQTVVVSAFVALIVAVVCLAIGPGFSPAAAAPGARPAAAGDAAVVQQLQALNAKLSVISLDLGGSTASTSVYKLLRDTMTSAHSSCLQAEGEAQDGTLCPYL